VTLLLVQKCFLYWSLAEVHRIRGNQKDAGGIVLHDLQNDLPPNLAVAHDHGQAESRLAAGLRRQRAR